MGFKGEGPFDHQCATQTQALRPHLDKVRLGWSEEQKEQLVLPVKELTGNTNLNVFLNSTHVCSTCNHIRTHSENFFNTSHSSDSLSLIFLRVVSDKSYNITLGTICNGH